MSSENLGAALALVAQAVKTHLDNSLVTFVPLGLGQLYRVLQGHEVCLLLPSSAPGLCRLVQTSFPNWMHCMVTEENRTLCAPRSVHAQLVCAPRELTSFMEEMPVLHQSYAVLMVSQLLSLCSNLLLGSTDGELGQNVF